MKVIPALGFFVFGLSASASASFTYTLSDTAYDSGSVAAGVAGALDPVWSNSGGFFITVSSAAVARGSFVLHTAGTRALGNPGSPGFLYSGDLPDLVVFNDRGERVTSQANIGTLDVNLTFDSNGNVVTGKVDYTGISEEIHLSGSSDAVSGFFGFDNATCHFSVLTCGVSGQLVGTDPVDVPEPSSLAGLLAAFGALGLVSLLASARS